MSLNVCLGFCLALNKDEGTDLPEMCSVLITFATEREFEWVIFAIDFGYEA